MSLGGRHAMSDTAPLTLILPREFDTSEAARLHERLRQHLNVGPPHHVVRKSVDLDAGYQIIQLIGDLANWLPLQAAAGIFLGTLAKRAADALWDAAAAALKRPEVRPLADVSDALAKAMAHAGPETELIVGLDIPERNWGTVLIIKDRDPVRIAHALAVFAGKADQLSSVMKAEVKAGRAPMGRAIVEVDGDGLVVRWRSQADSAANEARIP